MDSDDDMLDANCSESVDEDFYSGMDSDADSDDDYEFIDNNSDDSVKLWTLDRPTSVRTFKEHAYCVYATTWNPRHADVFASASGDLTVRIRDMREPTNSTMILPTHEYEVLNCDWNKYDDCVLATCSVDKSVKVWDVRNFGCQSPC